MKLFVILTLSVFLYCKTNLNYLMPIDSNSEKVNISKIGNTLENQIYLIEDYNYWKTNSLLVITRQKIYFFSSGWSSKSARKILWKVKALSTLPFGALLLVSPSLEFTGGILEFTQNEMIPIYIHKEGYFYLMKNWMEWQKQWKKNSKAGRKFLPYQRLQA